MSMTADELNRRLAEALGGVYHPTDLGLWMPKGFDDEWLDFNPAYHVDDLRDYVLPEITRRKKWPQYKHALAKKESAIRDRVSLRWYATADPAVLAEAALEALEGERWKSAVAAAAQQEAVFFIGGGLPFGAALSGITTKDGSPKRTECF